MLRKTLILLSAISAVFLNATSLVPRSRISNAREDGTIAAAAIVRDPSVGELLQQVNRDRALNDLRQLSGETPMCVGAECTTISNRFTGSVGLGWAMDYLRDNLVSMGYSTEFRDWSASGYSDQDLIARKEGTVTPAEEIYIVAHVDGIRSTGGRGPAADDNGSGTVDLLELARIIEDCQFERTSPSVWGRPRRQRWLRVSLSLLC